MGFFSNGQKAANRGNSGVDASKMSSQEREKTLAGKAYQEKQNSKK